jgi:endonuclease YncB( thermonuclease family)
MSEAQPVPAATPKSGSNRKRVLFLVAVIVAGSLWGVFKIATWAQDHIIRVIDANKVFLNGEQGLLLIGADCPPYMEPVVGKPAQQFVIECVLDRKVRVEPGEEKPMDDAHWLMGYIYYRKDGRERFLNEDLLRLGYARYKPAWPYLKYRRIFEAAEAEAKQKQLGVWAPGYKFPGD